MAIRTNRKFGLPPIECGYDNPHCAGGYTVFSNGGLWIPTELNPPFYGTSGGNGNVGGSGGLTVMPNTVLPVVVNSGVPPLGQTPNDLIQQIKTAARANPLIALAVAGAVVYLITK